MTKTIATQSESALILASSSPYRRELLARLRLPFECRSPDVDESVVAGESPVQTCVRLAELKARAVAAQYPLATVIGSDQVLVIDGQAVSKPGSHPRAVEQLRAVRGKEIVFHSAVCVIRLSDGLKREFCVPTTAHFRDLGDAEIERYLLAETPYDCAGSAKSEGLGITLLRAIRSDDPTALPGLPLIALSEALRQFGFVLP